MRIFEPRQRAAQPAHASRERVVGPAGRDGPRGLAEAVRAQLDGAGQTFGDRRAQRFGLDRQVAVHQAHGRQVGIRKRRMVHQFRQEGRETEVVHRHPLRFEHAQRGPGGEMPHRDVSAAGLQRRGDRHDGADVIHWQWRPEPVVFRHAITMRERAAIAHDRLVAQQATLWVRRRARGVQDQGGVADAHLCAPGHQGGGIDAIRARVEFRLRHRSRDRGVEAHDRSQPIQALEREVAVIRQRADAGHEPLDQVHPGGHLARGHHARRVRVRHQISQFRVAISGIDRHRDRACERDAEQRLDEGHARRQQDGDVLAALHAECHEAAGTAHGTLRQAIEGDALLVDDDRVAPGPTPGRDQQEIAQSGDLDQVQAGDRPIVLPVAHFRGLTSAERPS